MGFPFHVSMSVGVVFLVQHMELSFSKSQERLVVLVPVALVAVVQRGRYLIRMCL